MAGKSFDRQMAGKPLIARTLNRPIAEAERLSNLSVSAPFGLTDSAGGSAIADQSEQPIWAKITSGTNPGPYAFTEQYPTGSGAWTNGYLTDVSGADPAYNSVTGVTLTLPVIVLMERGSDGHWYFSAGSC